MASLDTWSSTGSTSCHPAWCCCRNGVRTQAALGQALFTAVREKGCASWKRPQQFDEVKEWGRAHLLTAVDLLTAWFRTCDPLYKELFAGFGRVLQRDPEDA